MSIIETMRRRNMPETPADPDSDTLKMMDNIVRTAKERDTLREQVQRLEASLAQEYYKNEYLGAQLVEVTRKRDFYMRHSTALITRLNDISMIIGQALEAAKHEAFKPETSDVPTPAPDGATELAMKFAPEKTNETI